MGIDYSKNCNVDDQVILLPDPLFTKSIQHRGSFENPESQHGEAVDFLKWIFNRKREAWPKWVESEPGAVAAASGNEIQVTFVNHSTFLIQVDGMNILTDPIWSDRAGPLSFLGVKRVRSPGLKFEALPAIDCVLVSHNHYDHMDIPTLKALERKFSPLFVVGLGNRKFLENHGLSSVEELDWWDKIYLPGGRNIYFVPAQHFSGRSPWGWNRSLWGGFVIESMSGKIYFAGDTGFGKFFYQIHEKFPEIDIALLPIGAYEPKWFMSPVHLGPEDAVRAHLILKPELSVGIHIGTFRLSDEGINTPAQQLEQALREHGIDPKEFIALDFGETVSVPINRKGIID